MRFIYKHPWLTSVFLLHTALIAFVATIADLDLVFIIVLWIYPLSVPVIALLNSYELYLYYGYWGEILIIYVAGAVQWTLISLCIKSALRYRAQDSVPQP